MPSVYHLQPKFQYLPRPVTNGRARPDRAANQVRIAALVLSLTADAGVTLLIVLMVLLAAIGEMIAIIAALNGASRRYDSRMEKNDRALGFVNRSRTTLAERRSRTCS